MPRTEYTIHNAWGDPLFPTNDADEAEFYAERDCTVTAVTRGEA